MVRVVKIRFGIGYGRHYDEMEFDNGTSDVEIEEAVRDNVLERVDWGFEIIDEEGNGDDEL